jgi:hypothetical protein
MGLCPGKLEKRVYVVCVVIFKHAQGWDYNLLVNIYIYSRTL